VALPTHLGDLYHALRQDFRDAGMETADLEARMILTHRTAYTWSDLIAKPEMRVSPAEIALIEEDQRRRLAGEPLSRVYGTREFWGLEFTLCADTLDPRPDTETLVEAALDLYRDRPPPSTILDLGTGSGCILVALLHEFPHARGCGVDKALGALQMARHNARGHGVEGRAAFICADWAASLTGRFDLIVSNPPYIVFEDLLTLAPEVKNHDPILALDGGRDGLSAYRSIFTEIKNLLNPGGRALFEIGAGQEADVMRLAEESRIRAEGVHRDLAGLARVLEFSRGDN
jgi:release factor glutamine methyltransferase